ncbi:hypothetical protein IGB42_02324 [Andreprevotia sp. IGB-42]|uniref:FliH/SctL family protein n=1 Tax=Andreprevotia sp. IGB-42 TaxID=2497473 RepID=UPI0013593CF4|nr:FliH/SctL family protein [Andreprevotia sp. IGB-42]KAF0813395.1 hypothetical protein IGB42_02324 [Andreprevotia sp. IGB-42]
MAPIIRKPAVSTEKRTLQLRNANTQTAMQREVPSPAPSIPAPAPAAVAPVASPPVITARLFDEQEMDRRVAAATQVVQKEIEAEMAQLRAKAQEQGYTEGMKRAQAQVDQSDAERAKRFELLLTKIEAGLQRDESAQERLSVSIAYEALCKIAGEALLTRDGVLAVVRQVLGRLRQRQAVTIYLAPDDLRLVGDPPPELAETTQVTWAADARVGRGGCLIETPMGELDARLESQLQIILEAFLAAQRASR